MRHIRYGMLVVWITLVIVMGCAVSSREPMGERAENNKQRNWPILFKVDFCWLRIKNEKIEIVDKALGKEFTYIVKSDGYDVSSSLIALKLGRGYDFSLNFWAGEPISETSLNFSCWGSLGEKRFKERFNDVRWGEEVSLVKPVIIEGELWMLVGSIRPTISEEKKCIGDDNLKKKSNH